MLRNQLPDKAQLQSALQLSFPSDINLDEGVEEINALQRRLKNMLPDYDIVITRQVARPEYTQKIIGVADDTDQLSTKEDYEAEITIRGPVR